MVLLAPTRWPSRPPRCPDLVQGSPKPIVLTGSAAAMASPFTDAKLNLYQSLLFAADDRSCDVSVVFGGAVIAGTRARNSVR